MASQTALICKRYAAECTKTRVEILQPENSKKEKNAPDSARKRQKRVRFGCWRGWERLRTGENGWERLAIGQKDLSRLPPRVLLPSGERPAPTEAGAETGAWTQPTGLQVPTTRTAGGPAGAPRCQILAHTNEKVRYRRSDT